MIDTTDILLKATEDVQAGLWCKGAMFQSDEAIVSQYPGDPISFTVDQLSRMNRCAIGSLALATMHLGGTKKDYEAVCERVASWIEIPDSDEFYDADNPESAIVYFNDHLLPDDPFSGGSQLADLFRRAAEGC